MTAWRLVGGSVTGSRHREQGQGCEDAHGWTVRDALVVAATADGAGSRPGTSALGAGAAVQAVLAGAATAEFDAQPGAEAAVGWLFRRALADVTAEAERSALPLDLLATTLSVVVIDGDRVAVGQVGDGIAVCGSGDHVRAVAVAERFEYANETVFLTTPDALSAHCRTWSTTTTTVDAVALSTDGLRYKVLDDVVRTEPFVPFFTEAWAYARRPDAVNDAVLAFLADVDDQTGDDKTLVLAVRTGDPC